MAQFIARNFRPLRKNTLRGFVEIETPSGLVISDVTLHEQNGRRWLSMPARQYEKDDGEKTWAPCVKFRDRDAAERFQSAALPAVLDAFQQAEGDNG